MTFEVRKGLIIEDDPATALLLYHVFPPPQWTLDVAATFRKGIQKIEEMNNGYDFIFADLNLPDSAGEDTLKRIHQASVAPIIACSGDDMDQLEKRQRELGVYGIIRKGSWRAYRVRDVIEGAMAKWTVERYEVVTNILRETTTKWRKEFLSHEA